MGIDGIEKLVNGLDGLLAQEEKRQVRQLKTEIENCVKELADKKRVAENEIIAMRREFEDYRKKKQDELTERERVLRQAENDIKSIDSDRKRLAEERKDLDHYSNALKLQERGLEDAKKNYIEKAEKADLLINEYNKRLEELSAIR